MSEVPNTMKKLTGILAEAGEKNTLNEILQPTAAPDADAVYRDTQAARVAQYTARIEALRGDREEQPFGAAPEPQSAPSQPVAPVRAAAAAPLIFPRNQDLRSLVGNAR
jgi:hypothetical protein